MLLRLLLASLFICGPVIKQAKRREKQRKIFLQSTVQDRQKPQGPDLWLRTTEPTILAHDFGPCLPLHSSRKKLLIFQEDL
jgi:hypothetical protein